MTRVGDDDRERAAATLREHFVRGRLTVEELTERTERALTARSTSDIRRALRSLPAPQAGTIVRTAIHGAALIVLTGAWFAFSIVLLLVVAMTLLIHGVSVAALAAFLLFWLVPTVLLSRLWHRVLPRRRTLNA